MLLVHISSRYSVLPKPCLGGVVALRHLVDGPSHLTLDTSQLTLVPARLNLGTSHLTLVSSHLALVPRGLALEDVPPHHLTLGALVPIGGAGINPDACVWHAWHGVLEGRVVCRHHPHHVGQPVLVRGRGSENT